MKQPLDTKRALEFKSSLGKKELLKNTQRMIDSCEPDDGLDAIERSARLLVTVTAVMATIDKVKEATELTEKFANKLDKRGLPDGMRKYAYVTLISEVAAIIDQYARGEFLVE